MTTANIAANADILLAARAIPAEKMTEFAKCVSKYRDSLDQLPHGERVDFLDKIVAYVLRPIGTTGKMSYSADEAKAIKAAHDEKHPKHAEAMRILDAAEAADKKGDNEGARRKLQELIKCLGTFAAKNNPFAIATAKVGRKNPEKYERAVKDIKKTLPHASYDAKVVGKGDAMDRLAHEAAMFSSMSKNLK